MQLATTERSAPNLVMPVTGKPLTDLIHLRRELLRDALSHTYWGRVQKIVFDPTGMNPPDWGKLDHTVVNNNFLSWENQNPEDTPKLALTRDQNQLLFMDKLPPLAPLFGPDRDDTSRWIPTQLPGWQTARAGDPTTVGKMPRRYQQRYSDLTLDFISSVPLDEPNFADPDCFYIIQPVYQILIKVSGQADLALITPQSAPDGTHMGFLVNPRTCEAHLLGGRIRLDMRLHTLPDKATA